MGIGRWTIQDCDVDDVASVAQATGLSDVAARVLVRRGLDDPAAAKAFLDADALGHDPFLLGDMSAAVARLRRAVETGERICVHGDYDVDGICATAVAVLALRELGADVTWHLPSRFDEGYGLAGQTLERLAADGVGLVLTVDCGITAVDEIARARAAGLDVVVTDHHRPGDALPDCPIVATRPSSYPFPELCGTGVVHKLVEALLGRDHPALTRELDLVALATIADVVPLVDENRALVRAGLRRLARTTRPGLRALMRSARVDPAALDASSVGFRLAPRINAAGRLERADTALALLLADDEREAERLAGELEGLNRERQAVEDRILRDATSRIASWPESERARRGYVLWDEGWHEGVIGIVASRLVERFGRPVVLITASSHGWKGSGRSIAAFDLHGALGACAEHLERFGGHRAAAGLSISTDRLEAFATAFADHADAVLTDADLCREIVVDAVVPASALTLRLAQELGRLAPFGLGNPDVTLLVAGVDVVEPATVGDGKHLRFRVRQHGRDGGSAIAFGQGAQLERLREGGPFDIAFRLKENHWNGSVAAQLVVRQVFEAAGPYARLRDELLALWRSGEQSWSPEARRIFDELGLGASGGGRQLLESPTFRALLADSGGEALPRAA